uniref:E3 ubiquitin-protein ligase Sina-like RING finger domain-containing protein n=1 Tax=Glossina pallidipes TaxID=7398 RepID=A0A1A9ZZR9_GLOPL
MQIFYISPYEEMSTQHTFMYMCNTLVLVIKPPGWQCCNGHVLCNNCRSRSVKCPVCRVPLGPRGRCLLSDKLFTLLAESFPCDGGEYNNDNYHNVE